MALEHFRYFLESRNFTIYTDQKPIVTAIQSEADRDNARQARQLVYISKFTTDIRHLPDTSNVVADALSRQEINALFRNSIQIDLENLAKAQAQDKELLHFLNTDHSFKIKQVPVAETDLTLMCDESLPGKLRPLVPLGYRRTIFNNIHNLSHSGVKSTTSMISDRYVWPDSKKNVVLRCRNCIDCQNTKVRRHNITNLQRYPPLSQKFVHINVDLAGPLPSSNGCTCILVIVISLYIKTSIKINKTKTLPQRRSSRPPNPPIGGGGQGQLWRPKLV